MTTNVANTTWEQGGRAGSKGEYKHPEYLFGFNSRQYYLYLKVSGSSIASKCRPFILAKRYFALSMGCQPVQKADTLTTVLFPADLILAMDFWIS